MDELEVQDTEGMNNMFLVEKVTVKTDSKTMVALAFHDNGSNVTMVRNELAEKLGLAGSDVKHKLVRSGGDEMDWETKAYNIPLLNSEGKQVVLTAMGVDEISSEIKPADVEPALKVFPQIPDLKSIKRPSGKVDLLIGLNFLEVQPTEVAREEGLSLWKSKLGSGYLLGGTHPEIWLGCPETLASGALEISRATTHASYMASHHTQLARDENFLKARGENFLVAEAV